MHYELRATIELGARGTKEFMKLETAIKVESKGCLYELLNDFNREPNAKSYKYYVTPSQKAYNETAEPVQTKDGDFIHYLDRHMRLT